MMKRFLILTISLVIAASLFAAQRTAEQAAAIAAEFTNAKPALRKAHRAPLTATSMRLAHTAMKNQSADAAFYIFNNGNDNGYVVVAADDRAAADVLCYAEEGSFDEQNISPAFSWWLKRYQNQLSSIPSDVVAKPRKAKQTTEIAPLLGNIAYNQGSPYNDSCPIDQYNNKRSLTGCVATAAVQIMRKWKWPTQGVGSHSYTWKNYTAYEMEWDESSEQYYEGAPTDSVYTEVSANFGATTYDWDNMREKYTGYSTKAQKKAIATIMFHAGVACEMAYASFGSGSFTDDMAHGLVNYFDYQIDKFISEYTLTQYYGSPIYMFPDVPFEGGLQKSDFEVYIDADLEAGRPVMMGGSDFALNAGHEFVCDGRDSDGKYHINWGWSGTGTPYCELSALEDGDGYDFSYGIDALIGLRPNEEHQGGATAIENATNPNIQAIKRLENGQITIIKGGIRYNPIGQKL